MIRQPIRQKCFFVTNSSVSEASCSNARKNNRFESDISEQPGNLIPVAQNCSLLTLFSQNVCGISTKKDSMDLYLEGLGNKPSYICLTEHFLNKTSLLVQILTNYDLVTGNSRSNMIRGGSLILGVKDCACDELPICKRLYKRECFEICGVKDKGTGLNICCVYRTSTYRKTRKSTFEDFMENLEKLLDYNFDKKCVICGDFNVDLLKDGKEKNDFVNLLKCYNFRTLVNSVTYACGGAESCLDNILTNVTDEDIHLISVDHNGLSDGHAGILCSISLRDTEALRRQEQAYFTETRVFNTNNNNTFRELIQQNDWNREGINSFLKKFKELFTLSFRKRKKKINLRKANKLKWVTKGIAISSKMKRFLSSAHRGISNESIIDYKVKYMCLYRRVLRKAKQITTQAEIIKAKNSTKDIWKVVNRHRNKKVMETRTPIRLKENNIMISKPQDIANTFSNNFNHSSENDRSSSTEALNYLKRSVNRINNEMKWDSITPNEICVIVNKMPLKRSCGFDEIPITVIKDNIDILSEPLSYFYNECVREGIFPDQFKIAKILPIYKKDSKTDPKNYRPISLLPTLSKIFEKIIKSRLLTHLKLSSILNSRQYGYQGEIGTTDAIDTLLADVVEKLNEKERVAGLFLDLSSAFDLVDHKILIEKLEYYGVRNEVLKLFKSYLSNRLQYVEIRNIEESKERIYKSKLLRITRGVPQGSILGPILFIIFVNDLIDYISNVVDGVKLVVYADDTNAIVSDKDKEQLNFKINAILAEFHRWFTSNNLKLNTSKTSAVLFKTTARNKETLNINLNGEIIDLQHTVKFLGVNIDNYLNWKVELDRIEKNISSACYALRSLRDELTVKQLKIIYYALVESKLRYSIQFWGNSYNYNMNKAFIIQKRAIRTILRIPQIESCKDHFITLEILTAPALYIMVVLCLFKKQLLTTESDSERLARENTRRKDVVQKIHPTLNVVKHSRQFQAVKLFNALPLTLKSVMSYTVFKRKLRELLVIKAYYSVHEYLTDKHE